MFLRQVKTLECLSHPRIVSYKHSWLELHRSNPFCPFVPFLFILMSFCSAGNLETLVLPPQEEDKSPRRRKGRGKAAQEWRCLSDDQVWGLFLDILLGLQYLHHQGILHR